MAPLFITLLRVLELTIIADAFLSWVVPNKEQFPRSITSQLADPLCAPFRKLIGPERTGGFDLSPLVALILLQVMRETLTRAM
ncbi:MAG: YggT family protein [Polyangiales bacterium]